MNNSRSATGYPYGHRSPRPASGARSALGRAPRLLTKDLIGSGAVPARPREVPFRVTPRQSGFTLVEVLIALTVVALIAGIDVVLLQAALEAWEYGSHRVSLQRAADELMENLLEGGFDGEGIRDAVELKQAELSAIGFIPLWTDRTHKPDSVRNPDQKFILEKQFKPGATIPIGQIKPPDSEDFLSVPVKFTYGNSRDPKVRDDVVQFLEAIPPLSEIRILYTPDGETDLDVVKIFRWDSKTKRVYESYAGKTRDIIQHDEWVEVQHCAFLYYDNLNRLIAMKDQTLSSLAIKRATAVKLYLLLKKKGELRELTSFTNIRNVTTIGATVTEGAELPMPMPGEIKAFSLGDFFGLKKEGIVELIVKTKTHKGWKIRLKFKKADREEDLILERFQMESPPGKITTSAVLNQVVAASEFVNLQTLDRSGLYDYDDDEDVKDSIVIQGANPTVTVKRLDFEGASLFIRP